jgi:hypothetical protein
MSTKVSVFQQDQINYHHRPSQRSYLAQTLIKTIKQNYYRGNNVYLLKNGSKNKKTQNKNWVASQQALLFNAPS